MLVGMCRGLRGRSLTLSCGSFAKASGGSAHPVSASSAAGIGRCRELIRAEVARSAFIFVRELGVFSSPARRGRAVKTEEQR